MASAALVPLCLPCLPLSSFCSSWDVQWPAALESSSSLGLLLPQEAQRSTYNELSLKLLLTTQRPEFYTMCLLCGIPESSLPSCAIIMPSSTRAGNWPSRIHFNLQELFHLPFLYPLVSSLLLISQLFVGLIPY